MLQNLQHLLSQVSAIHKKYEGIARITGENFNIFKLLRVETEEVRTHSAMLAMLLNPEGMHEQGNIFLKLFLEQFAITFIDADLVEVFVERSTNFGRIDILMQDNRKNIVLIENKIYAKDQPNQLWRYYQYAKSQPNVENIKLFYLTLWGYEPSEDSLKGTKDNEKLSDGAYECISYESNIIQWLEQCQEKAHKLPLLRETIAQYIHLIKFLTNQNTNAIMANEIAKEVLNSEESLKAFFDLKGADNAVALGLSDIFFKQLVKGIGGFNPVCSSVFSSFTFSTQKLQAKGLKIEFETETNKLCFGYTYENKPESIDLKKFESVFSTYGNVILEHGSENWACWVEWRLNWNLSNKYACLDIYSGKFAQDVKEIVEKMLAIVDEVFQE